ncbi:hypothetical protein CCAN11_770008 [Capnocytophaga canimorsus]|uniref:Uncharacterized protein n=1 Tax=Capnocytophaga canimorsus TaxID=28188 RepID=A0A0B7IRT4_9FLAO|nr:hypothetical protein CCAN11_770008 [Capnocytophaga canimorsus]
MEKVFIFAPLKIDVMKKYTFKMMSMMMCGENSAELFVL